MGLKCSLLGHEYGEPETEREREERGDEVVETTRTVEVCERCGRERVVSENTEVRSVQPAPSSLDASAERGAPTTGLDAAAAEVNGTPDVDGDVNATGDESEPADGGADDDGGLAAAVERVESEGDDGEPAAGGDAAADTPTAGVEGDDAPSAEEDDGVILTDDGEETEPDRDAGEWPSSDDTREDERLGEAEGPERATGAEADDAGDASVDPEEADDAEFIEETADSGQLSGWPDQDGDDEGFAAERATAGGTDVSFGGGLTPGDEEGAAGTESAGAASDDPRSGIASAGPLDTESRGRSAERAGELVCPECGERTTARGSSLRAGDICPACHRGYLAETDGDE